MMSKEEREAKLVEERRKKRKEILEKYQDESKPASSVSTPADVTESSFSLQKTDQPSTSNGHGKGKEVSAADYDPSEDRESDNLREEKKLGHQHYENQSSGDQKLERRVERELEQGREEEDEWEEIEVEDDEDEVEDMFNLTDDDGGGKTEKKKKIIRVRKGEKRDAAGKKVSSNLSEFETLIKFPERKPIDLASNY